jgi:hypothetical protein
MFRNLAEDATIEIYFETFASTGAPVAPSSAFTTSDFAIYKNGSATAKATTNGLTVTSPFNSETGCHLLIIDTSNDTGDAGFWTTGARYQVKFNTAKTVDSKSIDGRSVPRGSFGIQSEYMRGTDSAALATGVNVTQFGGTNITAAAGIPEVRVASIANNAITAASMASDAGTEIGAAVLSALGTGSWATSITDKTGNIPADPADASDIAAAFSTVNTTLATIAGYLDTEIAAIKARTDNLPTDPADQSAVEAAITAAAAAIRGTDNDTLKSLSDQIDGISAGTGTGARTVTITVNDGATVLQNARVRVVEGVNTYTGLTNASGVVVFNLDDATYTVSITKSGYTYAGTLLIVDGTETRTYSMTVVSVTPPDDPALCAVTIHVFDQYGADMSGQPVEITFVKWDTTAADTPPVLSVPPVQTTDADGLVSVNLFREAVYRIVYGNAPYTRRVDVTIPDAGTYTVEI